MNWSSILTALLNNGWSSQQWTFENVDGIRYRLKNNWSDMYLASVEQAGQPLSQANLRTSWGSMIFNVNPL